MGIIILEDGWKQHIYDLAESIIVRCETCNKKIDVIKDKFSVMGDMKKDKTVVGFYCEADTLLIQSCLKEVEKSVQERNKNDKE